MEEANRDLSIFEDFGKAENGSKRLKLSKRSTRPDVTDFVVRCYQFHVKR